MRKNRQWQIDHLQLELVNEKSRHHLTRQKLDEAAIALEFARTEAKCAKKHLAAIRQEVDDLYRAVYPIGSAVNNG